MLFVSYVMRKTHCMSTSSVFDVVVIHAVRVVEWKIWWWFENCDISMNMQNNSFQCSRKSSKVVIGLPLFYKTNYSSSTESISSTLCFLHFLQLLFHSKAFFIFIYYYSIKLFISVQQKVLESVLSFRYFVKRQTILQIALISYEMV